jgi:hypothetical protein
MVRETVCYTVNIFLCQPHICSVIHIYVYLNLSSFAAEILARWHHNYKHMQCYSIVSCAP